MDYVHARRLDQRHQIGQRAVVADAEFVAPEPRQADRVGMHGVGQSGERRGASEVRQMRLGVRARKRLDLEGVPHDLGEQRRLESARPCAAARHSARRLAANPPAGGPPAARGAIIGIAAARSEPASSGPSASSRGSDRSSCGPCVSHSAKADSCPCVRKGLYGGAWPQ